MTRPDQLPPGYDLPAAARQRMRERVLAQVAGTGLPHRPRRPGWLGPVAVATGVLLAAGGLGAYQVVRGSDLPATDAVETAAPGPASASAAGVTDCGTFILRQGERLPATAVPCFLAAVRSGQPARLRVSKPSAEGDPIMHSYTAGADGRIEALIDMRQDRFSSSPGVVRRTCTGPAAVGGRPRADGIDFSLWLTFDQCSEPIVSD